MTPPIETVRISKQGRDQLIKVRRVTGIEQWNIICRWALCLSLREDTPPLPAKGRLEGGVEIQWKTFAGEYGDLFTALILNRLGRDGYADHEDGPSQSLRAHLHRGLGYLASGSEEKNIADFLGRWVRMWQ